MDVVVQVLSSVNAAAVLALAVVAVLRIGRGGDARRWGAAAFAVLAVVLIVSAVDPHGGPAAVRKATLCVLLAFPYLLLRFTASFGTRPRALVRPASALTAALILAALALPTLPPNGAPKPAWATVFVIVIVGFWTLLSVATIVGLWRGGLGQPTLARRRMRLMAAATAGINVLILVAGAGAGEGTGKLVVEALLLASIAFFALGFAPPPLVRLAWRQPEQEELRRATEELVGAMTVSAVTDALLPHVARIVGGSGAALCDADGTVVASYGTVPAIDGTRADEGRSVEVVPLSAPFGSLRVGTTRLTPFFGRDEVKLLHALGALADLSLARCVLNERELESQALLVRAREDAERANTAKSDFLSRMSHELRTPLNVVLGFAQLLEMRDSLAEKDREPVEYILKAGRHLLALINEVLDLSRIESGRLTISPEPVEVAELAGEAVDLIRPLARDRSIAVHGHMGSCRCHVMADRQRLKQVLLNLLSNAVKYNRDGGEVAVSCTHLPGGRLRLEVRDTGAGIPAPLMHRLFEPFDRLGAERGHVAGTGLGLALSRQLVRLMGGQIGAESREGEGSTFWIELATADAPRDGAPEAARPRDEAPAATPGQRRVLLVEDNLANLKLIEVLTADRTHVELVPAMTGQLGLELAREHRPDLILLDQHLPDLMGTDVLRRLKADPATRHIPVVIVSADATPGQVRRMRELGAAEYLTKPLDVPRFLDVIDGIIELDEA